MTAEPSAETRFEELLKAHQTVVTEWARATHWPQKDGDRMMKTWDDLRAFVADLAKDRARLDWIRYKTVVIGANSGKTVLAFEVPVAMHLRQAIDAAIQNEKS